MPRIKGTKPPIREKMSIIDWINLREVVLDANTEYLCGHCYGTQADAADKAANELCIQIFNMKPPTEKEIHDFRANS